MIITSSFVQEESQTWREKVEQTALHNAASKGFVETVKILIEHGPNVNLQDKVLIFFLIFVFSFVICDIVLLLWEEGDAIILFFCKISFDQYGWTPLHFATLEGYEEIVKILIEHGSNVDLQEDVDFLFFFYLFSHFWL